MGKEAREVAAVEVARISAAVSDRISPRASPTTGQRTVLEDDPELAQAALKIQAAQRGKKDRQEVDKMRREQDDNLKVPLVAPVGESDRLIADAEDPELAQAAVKIQAVQRGKKQRQELAQIRGGKELTLPNDEAEYSSPAWRSSSAPDEEDPELIQAAVKIQAAHRGKKDREEIEQIRRRQDGSVVPTQGSGVGHTDRVPSASGHERQERLQYGASQCFESEEEETSRPATGHHYRASQCFEDDEEVAKGAGIVGAEFPVALSEGNADDDDDAGIYDDDGFEATEHEQLSDDFEDESTTKDNASPSPIAASGIQAVDEDDEDRYHDDDEYENVDFEDDDEPNVEINDDEPEIKYSYQDDSDEAGLDMGEYDEFDADLFEEDSEGDD